MPQPEALPNLRLEARLNTLDWLLLTYSAHIAGVVVQRQDGPTHTLLTLHPRVGAWIQVGGHCE